MSVSGKPVALALVSVLIGASTAGAAPGLTVKGDAKAWAEIEAASLRLRKVKTYRIKMTGFSGSPVLAEYVNPDRARVIELGGLRTERVRVGNETRLRQGNGPWRCTGRPITLPRYDPTRVTGEVTAGKGPVVMIDRVRTQSYTYKWRDPQSTENPDPTKVRLFVATTSGLPKRSQTVEEKENVVLIQFDYYDYNAPITIALPPCR